ncbi:MAG TPA: hypothetical protein VLC92_01895 [Rhodocyclaceae bacterium]|nr:hypothetical protein [Rhodocyclaceae bacterium]
MKNDKSLRQFQKQSLRLQAQRHRLALRQEWVALTEPFSGMGGAPDTRQWMGTFGSLLSILPNRWSRILGVALVFWRLARRSHVERSPQPKTNEK